VSSQHATSEIRQLRVTVDENVTGCFLPVAANRQDILNCVEETCRPVVTSFDGFLLSPEWVAPETVSYTFWADIPRCQRVACSCSFTA
jgi:hypothetical protein